MGEYEARRLKRSRGTADFPAARQPAQTLFEPSRSKFKLSASPTASPVARAFQLCLFDANRVRFKQAGLNCRGPPRRARLQELHCSLAGTGPLSRTGQVCRQYYRFQTADSCLSPEMGYLCLVHLLPVVLCVLQSGCPDS